VFRVVAVYAVVGWLLVQMAGAFENALGLPSWFDAFVVAALAIGFPVAVVLAWAFELTPEGVKRAAPAGEGARPAALGLSDAVMIGAVVVVLGVSAFQFARPRSTPVVAASSAPDAPASARTADALSIAVLPFVNMSSDPEQEYFSDGLSEELLNQLAQIDALQVIGRTSSFAFKGRNEDLRTIGEQLGARHLLEGSVRKSGDRLRITAQLIDASSGVHLWSETYDRQLTDVFAIQDEIATAVADALSITLGVGARPPRYGGADSFEAYDAYLRGRALGVVGMSTGAFDFPRAIEELERAVALDPDYAQAWAELAFAYGFNSLNAGSVGRDVIARDLDAAERAARRAVELSPDLWEAQATIAWSHMSRRRWLEADAAFARARELAERDGAAMGQMYWVYPSEVGRVAGTLDYLRSMRRVDPLSPNLPNGVVNSLIMLGRDAEAEAEIARNGGLPADPPSSMIRLSWALARGDAETVDAMFPRLTVFGTTYAATLGEVWRSSDEARAAVRRLADEPGAFNRGNMGSILAFAAYVGEDDIALRLARDVYVDRDGYGGAWPLWLPTLKRLRATDAFKDLVRDMGLVELWRETGDWGDYCRPVGDDDFACE
jgi:TolB-like protein